MSAGQIASHGRIGKVSGMAIGSFGRLYRSIITEVIPVIAAIVEVMNLASRVKTVLNIESRIE